MHELGIVFSIIRDVEEAARENEVEHVDIVRLRIGEVSAIVPHYLEDCWKWAVQRTERMKGCSVEIETIPAVTWCDSCRQTYETIPHGKICPYCGSGETWLKQGNECVIQEIVV
ncbi:MAG: hydrogenase maturation nickel metallochaperone HypA [Eubacterium sp.]|nr:hydrogenase maturation nickel metallochaperone HypA [Eubacterium sp.]